MNLLVTASASDFARRLLTELLADTRVQQVVGLDRHESDTRHERFVQVVMDARLPLLEHVLQDIRAVIHLAPALAETDGATLLSETQNLCRCALSAGVRTLVLVSSAFIYDARAGDTAVNEDHARGAPAGCAAATALQALEDWLDGAEREHAGLRIVRLRPHWVLGPHSHSLLAWILRGRRTPRLGQPEPRLQCVHEDDLVQAIRLALQGRLRGAFNLATDDSATLHELHRQARWLRLPGSSPERAASRHGMDSACGELLRRPLTLDTTRARDLLDWQPHYRTWSEVLKSAR